MTKRKATDTAPADAIDRKYTGDAASIARQLETAARKLRARIDADGLKRAATLHNAAQETASIAADLELTIAVYRKVRARTD